jgi:hypothetical protein
VVLPLGALRCAEVRVARLLLRNKALQARRDADLANRLSIGHTALPQTGKLLMFGSVTSAVDTQAEPRA